MTQLVKKIVSKQTKREKPRCTASGRSPSSHAAPVVDAKGAQPSTVFFVVRLLCPGFVQAVVPFSHPAAANGALSPPPDAFLVTGVVRTADASGAFHLLVLPPLLDRLSPHLRTFGPFFILEAWIFQHFWRGVHLVYPQCVSQHQVQCHLEEENS